MTNNVQTKTRSIEAPIKVGIDATSLLFHRGVSRYTSNLVHALSTYTTKNSKTHQKAELYAFANSYSHSKRIQTQLQGLGVAQSRIAINTIPLQLQEIAWRFGFQTIRSFLPTIDVFHSWDWIQPPDTNLPLVSTIHDLAILKFPETAHPSVLAHHRASWDILKKRNAEIIAVSHSTKRDIITLLDFPEHKVTVIHEAIPNETIQVSAMITQERSDQIKDKLGIKKPFILAVGTREPRKNLLRVIQAWEPLSAELDLYIAGEAGWDSTTSFKKPGLHMLGKVSDHTLAVLYAEAEMLVYPSLDEGFGLPILEAFHHGTPVVTSQKSAMQEVAGNAAELVEPESVESIRSGITTILSEDTQSQKKRLQRMIIRLQSFSWQNVAHQTLQVYHKAINN